MSSSCCVVTLSIAAATAQCKAGSALHSANFGVAECNKMDFAYVNLALMGVAPKYIFYLRGKIVSCILNK